MAQTLTSNAFFTSDASGMNLMGMGAIFLSITYRINVNYKQIYITYPREREKEKKKKVVSSRTRSIYNYDVEWIRVCIGNSQLRRSIDPVILRQSHSICLTKEIPLKSFRSICV